MNTHPDHTSKRIGIWFIGLFWLLLLGLLTWFFSEPGPKEAYLYDANGNVSAASAQIVRSRNGHYEAIGKINQRDVLFMVDTGATTVAIPVHIAQEIGLPKGMEVTLSTANGYSKGWATMIDTLDIGSIRLFNVRATIASNMPGDEILLGMSALKQLEFTQSGNTLTLIDKRGRNR